jgi:hypothetical protein
MPAAMKIDRRLRPLAICLFFCPAVAAAEGGSPHASATVARTMRSGCAKLVCQRQAVGAARFARDRGVSSEPPASEKSESGLSLVMGLGAGAFHGPSMEVGLYTYPYVFTGDSLAPPDGVPIDFDDAGGGNYVPLGSRRTELEGPTVSFGVALDQPLLDTAALGVGLEERFTLAALLPFPGGSSVALVADFLLVASQPDWPIEVAVGPSLAAARLDVEGEDGDRVDEPVFIPSGAALLRLDLADTLPGTLDLVGHYGKSLNYEGSSYRDLQLAFALDL